jgi:carboxymethylenebutenolidase
MTTLETKPGATPILTHTVEIDVGAGTPMGAYVARPLAPAGTAVVVAGELFGISEHVREICEQLAERGHLAIAPDLHHRSAPWVELPEDEAGRARGFELLGQLTRAGVLGDLSATLTHLRDAGASDVAMLGLSVGGHIAYLAAAELPIGSAAVLYGGWLPTTDIPLSRPQPTLTLPLAAPLLYVVGEDDHVVPADHRRQIAAALRAGGDEHEFVAYPGVGHGFLNRRRGTYAPDAARDAHSRVEAFWREHRG